MVQAVQKNTQKNTEDVYDKIFGTMESFGGSWSGGKTSTGNDSQESPGDAPAAGNWFDTLKIPDEDEGSSMEAEIAASVIAIAKSPKIEEKKPVTPAPEPAPAPSGASTTIAPEAAPSREEIALEEIFSAAEAATNAPCIEIATPPPLVVEEAPAPAVHSDADTESADSGLLGGWTEAEVRASVQRKRALEKLSNGDICDCIRAIGLDQHVTSVAACKMDGRLLQFFDDDLLEHQLGIISSEHRRRILILFDVLR